MTNKEKIGRLEIQLKQKGDQNDTQALEIEKLKKERKHLVSERDKNKARIQKLIQRKVRLSKKIR